MRLVHERRLPLAVAAVALAAAAASWWRAGPAGPRVEGERDDVTEAAIAAVLGREGLATEEADVRLAPAESGPWGVGEPGVAFAAARRGADAPRDLYRVRFRRASTGVPTVIDGPARLTATPDGDEVLLDLDPRRVLYGVRIGDHFESVVLLDFERDWLPPDVSFATRWAAALAARQTWGTWRGPRRVDVVLPSLPAVLEGRLGDGRLALRTALRAGDALADVSVDLEGGIVEPAQAGRVLEAATPAREPAGLVADALRASPAFGPAAVAALEAVLFESRDGLRRFGHAVFPETADRVPLPVTEAAEGPASAWPPAPIVATGGLSGEGRWTRALADPALEGGSSPVLKTFVRVDPERPYSRVHLFAFDSARLGLHFVAGTRDPASTTGARGRGRIPDPHRPRLVAAFNGGFKSEHGLFGTIDEERVLVPPLPGYATIVLDPEGRAVMGRWDLVRSLPPGFTSLRQNLPPLVAEGRVNPTRNPTFGQVVARLDGVMTPRTALGITATGAILFAWAEAVSAEQLGEALRRAGARFAMHLDMNPGHTGLELYSHDEAGALRGARGAPEMDFRSGRWLETDPRDFFYLARRTAPADAHGIFTPVAETMRIDDPFPPVAVARRGEVQLTRLESDRLHGHVVPGAAQARPAGAALSDLVLSVPPSAWFDVGLADDGLVVGGQTWRPPRDGAMTFLVDSRGRASVGRWPWPQEAGISALWQGPALLAAGEPAGLSGVAEGPQVALGASADGRLLIATHARGDQGALTEALRACGVRDALLLATRTTPESGRAVYFRSDGTTTWAVAGPGAPPRPAELRPGAGSALVFVPRPPDPRASVVDSFATASPDP